MQPLGPTPSANSYYSHPAKILQNFPNGISLEYTTNEHGQPTGKGHLNFPNGAKCEFNYRHGQREGKAVVTFPDGIICQFTYKNSLPEGMAFLEFPTPFTYHFYFSNGQLATDLTKLEDLAIPMERVAVYIEVLSHLCF